jgi:hypothetical protein
MKVITYLMKVILSVPDEGYSRNVSFALNLISTFLFELVLTAVQEGFNILNHIILLTTHYKC